MAMTADLSVFLNTAEHADVATLNGVAVTGILDLASEVQESDVVTISPTFLLPTVDASAATDKTLVCRGVSYKVRSAPLDPESRDGAFTRLVLARS